MKSQLPETYRSSIGHPNMILSHLFPPTKEGDRHGIFKVPRMGKKTGEYFFCLASSGEGWDHVSVSIPHERRCPTWEEMCYIKDLFFSENEVVVQYHPSKQDYVNNHEHCLHLWRCQTQAIPVPDPILVGVR